MAIPTDYQVHMLRIWQNSSAKGSGRESLRLTLENTKTAIRVSFSDFETLVDYLQQQTSLTAET